MRNNLISNIGESRVNASVFIKKRMKEGKTKAKRIQKIKM